MKKFLCSKTLKVIVDVIEYILIFLAIFMLLFIVLQRTVFKDSSVFGFRTYTIVSDSMKPELNVGDVILVKEENPDNIKIGDVIVYEGAEMDYAGKTITHKVKDIKILDDGTRKTYTYGINNKGMMDPAIVDSQIFGKYIYKIQILSFFNKCISSVKGIVFLVVIITLFFFTKSIIRFIKKKELNKTEDEVI